MMTQVGNEAVWLTRSCAYTAAAGSSRAPILPCMKTGATRELAPRDSEQGDACRLQSGPMHNREKNGHIPVDRTLSLQ
jgi:hypothetical protein